MRKVSPALLVISGRRWKGKSRFFFDRKLEPDIWGDFEANLLASVQWLPLFKQEKLMVKLILIGKRPEVWPSCELDEVSDDEKEPPNVLFCMEARVKIITMDSLQKSRVICFEVKAINK